MNKTKKAHSINGEEKVVEPLSNETEENAQNSCEDEACVNDEICENCDCVDAEIELSSLLDQEREKTANLTSMLQQLQADFDNYRKRNAKLAEEAKQKGVFDAVKALLPAFDAVHVAKKQITDENTLKGLEMVERELYNSLATLEITPIETVGKEFDANLHNAVVAESVEGVEAGQILEEYSAGFTSPNGVVRFASVKISK